MQQNKKTIILLLLVILTMISIIQLFGLSKEKKDYPYMPRQINLSGNIVNFSMPENFSKNFPADDLVENLDINNLKTFEENNSYTLLRRWWDFKNDSFFSKDVGSMMMTIHVYEVLDKSKNISHPIEFIQAITLDMIKRDKEENSGKAEENKVHYPEHYQSFIEERHNKKRWLSSGSGTSDETTKVFHYWIPISEKNYLTVEFNFAPNSNISMRPFIDTYCRNMLEKIMSSFDVIYSNENTVKLKLENNVQLKLDELIENIE